MTEQQSNVLNQLLQGLGPQANQAISQLLSGGDQGQMQDMFQQAFIDPAMLTYEQQVLPAIQQRFVDAGAGSSSALNQALGQSAADLSTMLGTQMGQFSQFQQQLKQQGQLGALGQVQGAIGQRQFDPIIQQREGLMGPLIGLTGQLGAAGIAAASSRKIKENITSYMPGIEVIRDLEVKKYNYIHDLGDGNRERIGLIAEDVPDDVQVPTEGGVLGVDIYGLLAITINAVKQLTEKVEALEAK